MGLTEVAMVGEATAEATVVALGPEDPVPRAWTDMSKVLCYMDRTGTLEICGLA